MTDSQAEIFEIIARRLYPRVQCITYTQFGKSDVSSMAILTRLTTFAEKWAIVAPTNKKAKIIMGYLIGHIFDNELSTQMFQIEKGESAERIRRERSKDRLTFRFPDGQISEVFIISTEGKRTKDVLDALLGFGAPNIILDESSLVDDPQYAGVFRMLGGHKDNFLFEIGNPMRRNHFYKTSKDEKYHRINIDYTVGVTEGRIDAHFVEEMRTKPFFEQLYENKFPKADMVDTDGYTPLVTEDFLESRLKDDFELFGNLYLGCDVAGEGANYSVIKLRGRNGAKTLYKANNPDTMNFAAIIATCALEVKETGRLKRVYVDKVGIGKPVYDRLREFPELEGLIVGVMAGEKPEDELNFFNKRAEMFWRMRDWLSTSYLEGKEWYDMGNVRYKIQSDKKVKIKSKEEMRKEGIESPDDADALSLTFYDRETEFGKTIVQEDKHFREAMKKKHMRQQGVNKLIFYKS